MANDKQAELERLQAEVAKLQSRIEEESEEKIKELSKPTEVLHRWTVPSRVFIKRDRRWFVSLSAIILVFIILAAFIQDILLIFVLVALMFIMYLLGTVEPADVTHEIMNKGIHTADKLFKWADLKNFWFTNHQDWVKLFIETEIQFPKRLIMLVDPKRDQEFFNILKDRMPYFEMEKQDWISRINDGEYIPLEKYMPTKDLPKVETTVENASE